MVEKKKITYGKKKKKERQKVGHVRNHTFELAAKSLIYHEVSFTLTIKARQRVLVTPGPFLLHIFYQRLISTSGSWKKLHVLINLSIVWLCNIQLFPSLSHSFSPISLFFLNQLRLLFPPTQHLCSVCSLRELLGNLCNIVRSRPRHAKCLEIMRVVI